MERITVKVNGKGEIIPTNNHDKMYLLQNVKIDTAYQCKITKGRSLKSLGKYWLIISSLTFHFGGSDAYWHETLKKLFLPTKEIFNILTGKNELYVSSVNFNSMDEISFKKYLNDVINLLAEKGINADELIKTAN